MKRNEGVILGCLLLIGLVLGLTVISGLIFTFLWNIAIPAIFGGPTISLIEGTALMLLIWSVGAAFRVVVTK